MSHINYRCVLKESGGNSHGSIITEAVERQIHLLESFLSGKQKLEIVRASCQELSAALTRFLQRR